MPAGLTLPRSHSPSALSPASNTSPSPTINDDLDLAALTSDSFTSEADWLNAVVEDSLAKRKSSDQSLAEVESTLTRALHSLDISVGDTSAAVDRLINEISLSVPRLTFDLQLMRENALLLRFTLDGIRKRGGGYGTESEVGKVLERMRVLDLVKQRMEAARDVLREAESWSTLESEVTGLIGEDQYAKAAERLAEAARSMVVFQNTAEYEGRRALMVSLQNQLEASLSSGLVKAINERDVKGCKQLWNIFGMIQREQEYRTYYFSNRRGALVDSWTSAKLSDCLEAPSALPISAMPNLNAPTKKFVDALAHFYSDLQVLLAEERTYIPAIFPDPAPTFSSFIETTLEGLSPPIPQRLTSIADFYGPLVLPELLAAYKATEEFAVQVERTFTKLEPTPAPAPSPPAHSPTSPRPTHSPSSPSLSGGPPSTPAKRRMSKRRSLSKRLSARSISFATGQGPDLLSDHGGDDDGEEASAAQVRAWETALFEPFLDWQVEYPELERRYVAAEMSRSLGDMGDWTAGLMSGSSATGSEKGAKILLDKAGRVFSVLEEAISRNIALTHGYGARGLVDVMNEQLVAFFDRQKEDLMRAGREKGSASARRRAQATAVALAGGIASPDEEQEMVLEGLEYSTEDWSTFQFGLKLLDTCRGMAERLTAFEAKLKARMTVLAHAVREARESPSRYTVPGTTKGAILLLRQSTLNSAELTELLEPLEKPHEAPSGGSLTHPPPPPSASPFLLPKARGAATEFTRTTQLFLHDTILAPLFAHLDDYSTLACWTTTQEQRPGGKGAFDLAIPTFSLSPTETISRVGEGLFNLPRLFEVYADDDALAFSIETLPFVDVETLRALQQPPQAAPPMLRQGSGHRTTSSEALSGGVPASPALTRARRGSLVAGSSGSHASASQPVPVPLSAETVIATWLSSLTLSILSHLTSTVLPDIPRLSKHGSAQLVSDLEYLANVARALDVESPDELDSWRDAATLDDKALRGETETSLKLRRKAFYQRFVE
ncbi:componentof oligomeric golgi complex 7 [Rhodotorula toruloides]|uniref:Conserved oligomeric Golgi complex subunit 7 n=1 Tax=Rhodotorula toruloides TaxID=5286 RepID=A0A511KRM1_RHOTO|nr:componentof oligomeric golgi complex 7 [Rhodotorula toruloides]